MSFSHSVVRSPSYVLNSRAAVLRSVPYFASASPSIASQAPANAVAKCLTTLQVSAPRQQDMMPVLFDSTPRRLDSPLGASPEEPENQRKVKLGKSKLHGNLAT